MSEKDPDDQFGGMLEGRFEEDDDTDDKADESETETETESSEEPAPDPEATSVDSEETTTESVDSASSAETDANRTSEGPNSKTTTTRGSALNVGEDTSPDAAEIPEGVPVREWEQYSMLLPPEMAEDLENWFDTLNAKRVLNDEEQLAKNEDFNVALVQFIRDNMTDGDLLRYAGVDDETGGP